MIFVAKSLVLGAVLAFASYQDLETREIDDRVWLVGGAAGGALTLYEAVATPGYPYVLAGFSAVLTIALAFGVFYLGLYGGADAKALLAMALTFPVSPGESALASPFFPLSVLGNSLLLSLLLIPACLAVNFAWKLSGRQLFEGVSASGWRKAVALLTGFRVSASAARTVHFNLMEVPVRNGSGTGKGKGRVELKLFSRVTEEEEEKVIDERRGHVWVTPAIPMIVFFLVGYLLALVGWDLILELVSLIM